MGLKRLRAVHESMTGGVVHWSMTGSVKCRTACQVSNLTGYDVRHGYRNLFQSGGHNRTSKTL